MTISLNDGGKTGDTEGRSCRLMEPCVAPVDRRFELSNGDDLPLSAQPGNGLRGIADTGLIRIDGDALGDLLDSCVPALAERGRFVGFPEQTSFISSVAVRFAIAARSLPTMPTDFTARFIN